MSAACPITAVKFGGDFMTPRKGNNKIQNLMTQFSYEHRKLDKRLTKIRKNADELAKMLDSLPAKKDGRKEK